MWAIFRTCRTAAILALSLLAPLPGRAAATLRVDVHHLLPVPETSGRDDYYRVLADSEGVFLRAEYHPPFSTMVRGFQIPSAARHAYAKLRWRWRALTLPVGGNECVKGYGDSAAAVFATWKRGLKWYVLKYVWSTDAPKGTECRPHNGIFRSQRAIILESGRPVGVWAQEEVSLDDEFRRHFAGGNPAAEIPDLIGIGVMTDGDQTNSLSSADYAAIELIPKG